MTDESIAEMSPPPHIMVVVGEPSGDALGAELMAALKERTGGEVKITGVGGLAMEAEGLETLYSLDDTAVMGLREVVPAIPRIYKRIHQAADFAKATNPDVVVLIDAPDFTHRIGKLLKKTAPDLTIIKYVAPQVWASRPWRAKSLGTFIDHLLALLPFEPKFFEDYGLKTTFVGHPVVERAKNMVGGEALKSKYDIGSGKLVLGVLPGSRTSEIRFLLPEFRSAVEALAKTVPTIHTLMPAVPHVADKIRAGTTGWPTPLTILEGSEEKFAAFDAMDVALAASGTVSTELALASVPTVIGYKVGRLSGFIAQRLVQVPFASLVSIVIDEEIFPEYIQTECTGANLAIGLSDLIADPQKQARQKEQMVRALEKMGMGRERPSLRAADAILQLIDGK